MKLLITKLNNTPIVVCVPLKPPSLPAVQNIPPINNPIKIAVMNLPLINSLSLFRLIKPLLMISFT